MGIFSKQELPAGAPNAIYRVAGAGLAIIGLCAFLPWGSNVQARVAVVGVGIVMILLGQLRPPGFWGSGSIGAWRQLFGDRFVVVFYTAVGAVVAVGVWLVRLE